jgi:competence protein ComEC
MTNIAQDLLWPADNGIALRVVFLYVGQGSCSLILAAYDQVYKTALIDINLDRKNGGINVPVLIQDLVGNDGLDVFVNTHPHKDHLSGISELADTVSIKEVWHSGHVPSRDHSEAHKALKKVIKKVKECGGTERELAGSRSSETFGAAEIYTLAPAEYVKDEIQDESPGVRDERIHEHCAVMKFGVADQWIMIPGDADREAWEKHITHYHSDRIKASILAAPHHGSRSFFKNNEEDDPYLDALQLIAPDYIVISAPTAEESPHDHPHEDALDHYAEVLANGRDDILHTGGKRHCFICDIFLDGEVHIASDNGDLVAAYPLAGKDDGDGGGKTAKAKAAAPIVATKVDHRPMGSF